MKVYDCEYEFMAYNQSVAADTLGEAEQMVRDDAEDYKDRAMENEFAMRDLTRDIHVNVTCEVSEYTDDVTKAENYDDREDEVTDRLVY
jgi:hypothetical protein